MILSAPRHLSRTSAFRVTISKSIFFLLAAAGFAPLGSVFNYSLLNEVRAQAPYAPGSTVNVEDSALVLNGTGIRKATIFGIRVYEGSLYLKERNKNPENILASDTPKLVRMHFLRSVDSAKLAQAWREGIKRNNQDFDRFEKETEQLAALMPSVEENDLIELELTSLALTVRANSRELGRISAPGFSRAVLACWLGAEPPNEELKSGMLGL